MKKMEARDGGESSSACKTATSMAIDPEIRSSRAIAKGPRNVSFADQMGYVGGSSGSASYGWDLGLFDI